MLVRHISLKLKGKVLCSCVTQAYLYGLKTMAMTKKQHEKLQVCENKWVRRIAGVKRIDKRRIEELKEELDVKKSLARKLARSRLNCAGYVERMERVRLTKRADALRVQCRRRRGGPILRWEDWVKRGLAGVEGEWRIRARDVGGEDGWWRRQ